MQFQKKSRVERKREEDGGRGLYADRERRALGMYYVCVWDIMYRLIGKFAATIVQGKVLGREEKEHLLYVV